MILNQALSLIAPKMKKATKVVYNQRIIQL